MLAVGREIIGMRLAAARLVGVHRHSRELRGFPQRIEQRRAERAYERAHRAFDSNHQ